ncbi:hypothetical protein ACFQH5_15100 [Halomonas salifodinae]|uniref:Uncharacterized protein n=1 Tax=Halomonas salifodinae TaxID=438745 RepID=A0ABW2F3Q0_9GAMM
MSTSSSHAELQARLAGGQTPEITEAQVAEIVALEAKHGFPGLIIAVTDPEIAETMTAFQRQHARNWLRSANHRFGAELQNQLGRLPTVGELADRLKLSIDMHPHAAKQAAQPRH